MAATFTCRFCGGVRPHDGKRCLGCGAHVANATDRNRKTTQQRPTCPRCHSHRHTAHANGTLTCDSCGAWFDTSDDGIAAIDTRPEQNAMKRERRTAGRNRGRRR